MGKTPPQDLRRTPSAILWRYQNGAKWRATPVELRAWWLAAQVFIRWSRLGVWKRLLALVQGRGVLLGLAFLDGTNVRVGHGLDAFALARADQAGDVKRAHGPARRVPEPSRAEPSQERHEHALRVNAPIDICVGHGMPSSSRQRRNRLLCRSH